ncbi:MAG: DUF998 domain-containing protein [Sulfitobacter sp.]|nr:DUF998 domain-containing protein [Sulfitobacter sp.]
MTHLPEPRIAAGFIRTLAAIAVLGSISLLIGNVWGSLVVPNHDWVADTVSDLAAGRYEIIQDVSLYGYAAALLALALASAHIHQGDTSWSALTILLVLLAVVITVIGARNEYGDGDSEGVVIHIYLVYAMGALFAGVFGLMAVEGDRFAFPVQRISKICLVLWAIGAPVFFVLPTQWDGIWERGLGVITLVWCLFYAAALWRDVGQRTRRDDF